MQALHSGHNARDAWGTFNGLHQKVAKAALPANRPRRTKRERIREQRELTTRSGQDWHLIRADHPDNHVELKLDLGHAIRMKNIASRSVERARRNIDVQRESRLDEPVELYEDLIKYRVRLLAALNTLAVVEGRVGRAADSIRAHTDREIALLKRLIQETSDHVAAQRQAEEGDVIGTTFRRDTFMKDSQPTPPRNGRQWYYHLGNGPLSNVGLCLSSDEHGLIVDRFVMKDVWFTSHPNLWTDLHFWYGDPRDPTSKVPYAVHIMAHLTATEQENIVRMRSWRLAPENLMYRMMIEYCPNGDGQNLLNEHIALNHQQNSYIPEPAIWHIFNSLIKAGLAMERVFASENDQDNARKLAEVVHLDIKPDNIFLGDYPQLVPNDLAKYPREAKPGPNNFAMYPTCKLGDFGLATYRRLAENQRNLNSNTYIGRGTPGFFAPEQKPQYHGRRPNLNAKTNVWGVGITVMALMNLNVYAGHLQFQQAATDESDPLLVPAFTPAAIAEYSPELRQMVQACVQYRQNDRPSFTSLLTSLRHYTGLAPGYRDHALGARFGTRKALPPGPSLLGGLPEQKYALRMVMPDS